MGDFKEYRYGGNMYKLYVPKESSKGKSLPFIVMLHGCKQDPDQFAEETKMNLLAEKKNLILLYPAMDRLFNYPFDDPQKVNIDGCWNWFLDVNQHRGTGLPKSIVEMMDDAEKNIIRIIAFKLMEKSLCSRFIRGRGHVLYLRSYVSRYYLVELPYVLGYPTMQSILIYGQNHGPEQQIMF